MQRVEAGAADLQAMYMLLALMRLGLCFCHVHAGVRVSACEPHLPDPCLPHPCAR